jgi:hypothetical protein
MTKVSDLFKNTLGIDIGNEIETFHKDKPHNFKQQDENILTLKNLQEAVKKLEGEDPKLRDAFLRAMVEYKKETGKDVHIKSGARSKEKTLKMRSVWEDENKRGIPKEKQSYPWGVDNPDISAHVPGNFGKEGEAVDAVADNMPLFVKLLGKEGIVRPFGEKDPVHFELKEIADLQQKTAANLPVTMISAMEKTTLNTKIDKESLTMFGDIVSKAIEKLIPTKHTQTPSAFNMTANSWN